MADARVKAIVLDSQQVEFRLNAQGFALVAVASVHLKVIQSGGGQSIDIRVVLQVGKVGTVTERTGMAWKTSS